MAVLGSNSLNHSADLLVQRAGTTRITVTSTGLTLGGDVILGNAGTATNHAVRADRTISTGSGIDGGGNLTANRTFSVDSTVIRTTGNQTLGGVKTFSSEISVPQNNNATGGGVNFNGSGVTFIRGRNQDGASNTLSNLQLQSWFGIGFGPTITGQTVPQGENAIWMNVRTGDMSCRGNITASGTVTLAAGTTTSHAVRGDRTISTGSGLSGGGNLTANRTFAVDSTVIRTTGNQTMGGTKTFSAAVVLSTAGTTTSHAVRGDRTISTGSGLSGGGNLTANRTFAVDSTVVRTTGNQTVGGEKTFSSTIRSSIDGQGRSINVDGVVESNGYVGRAGVNGGTTNTFNIQWTGSAARLWIDTSLIGQIQISSDYRIKKDIQSIEDNAISRIMQLRPVSYKNAEYGDIFKEDPEQTIREGFIAHELAEVIPSAVEGEKDAPNQIQSLKLDSLLAVLTKGIQEQQLIIQELKSDLDQIKSSL